jgi:adenosylcobyric acid synthase
MVCGTTSDAGKSTVVTGLCRLLARRGVKVAPFKAQNMALNSAVTPSGHEIGRAQAAQAQAAGLDPEVAMNPILLKPSSDRTSQVVVMGRPWATLPAGAYHEAKAELWPVVADQLDDLRSRFDVVLCEGAGSPAEINLIDRDIVNLRVARHAGFPAILVGDIERGGVFAALYGTVELLPRELRALVQGFVINKFRGDPALLASGPQDLERRTGVPTLGVLPWLKDVGIDAEDSLAWGGFHGAAGSGLDVAVVGLPRLANFTDLDPLRLEPVNVRLVRGPADLGSPDLLILPGSKATIADLDWLRRTGLAEAITKLSKRTTILGICAGYQMLGGVIHDPEAVETPEARTENGIGLLPATTIFYPDKTTKCVTGHALGQPIIGYFIHHGRTTGADPWIDTVYDLEGSSADGVRGTSVHGIFEADGFRAAFLESVAGRAGKGWAPGGRSFAAARQGRFDKLADLMEQHLDLTAIEALMQRP